MARRPVEYVLACVILASVIANFVVSICFMLVSLVTSADPCDIPDHYIVKGLASVGGFLGTDASFFPDFVVVAMFVVLPAFFYGITLVKKGKRKLHGWVMGTVFGILFVTVVAFVIWARFYNDYHVTWEETELYQNVFLPFVFCHICIALSGLTSGVLCVLSAAFNMKTLENGEIVFKNEKYKKAHKALGWLSMVLFLLIAVTGFMIYYARYIYVHVPQ